MSKLNRREALRRLAAIPFAGSIPASGLVSAEYPNWRNETFELATGDLDPVRRLPVDVPYGISYWIEKTTYDRLAKVLEDAEEA